MVQISDNLLQSNNLTSSSLDKELMTMQTNDKGTTVKKDLSRSMRKML